MDWSDLPYAAALGQAGTLSAAARVLRVDHATVSRRVARLEAELGLPMFERTPSGYVPTPAGREVLAAADDIDGRIAQLRLALEPLSAEAAGPVRITALAGFFSEVVQPGLVAFRDRYPDIELTLDASTTYRDLARKEAEVAVRSPRPKQPNLVCRKAYRAAIAPYVSRAYVERFGRPSSSKRGKDHFVIRYAEELSWTPEEAWITERFPDARVPARAMSMQMQMELVGSGMGFGFLDCLSAERRPDLLRLTEAPVMELDYWLAAHEEAYKAPRVQLVMAFLAERCRAVSSR